MHSNFFSVKELVPLAQWHQADNYTKQVFSWLCDLNLGQAFGIFCLEWGTDDLLQSIPTNYSTYVITPGTEYVDWDWINRLCKKVPDSLVIVVCPYTTTLFAEPNLRLITFDVWPHNLKGYLDTVSQPNVSYSNRKYKISSLANRISQYRTYVNAHMYQTWDSSEYLMSWRKKLGKQEDLYLFNKTGNAKIDDLIGYIKNVFWDLKITPTEDFTNTPLSNLDYNWDAYTNCVINCSNESINNSYQIHGKKEHIQPGPYLTEKTYKTLLSGTALFAVGQYQTYAHLKSQGFMFNYPWDMSYDTVPGDIDRMALILECLDSIRQMSIGELSDATLESRKFNREYIFSGEYFQTVNNNNCTNIENFNRTL